ncbi:hypothetical protein BT67DRAFT_389898 [Trichocladium antarcticum]|uniref:ER membrane protein complex subunit 7 beta-sandwich domain-containing protein n=1 Tax=Trichocladium antarcticum TaxID=1450529 RepID=A0AAN6ZAJ9_9PEZI|nr:hypothetical protein BT67DRAFT_389898 [Trichocladium antarcticum]
MQLPSLLLSAAALLGTTVLASSAAHDRQSTTTTTTTLTLRIPASPPVLPNPHALPASTRATLTALGAARAAPLSAANTFVFRDVPAGSYLLDVHCPTVGVMPLRVDVGLRANGDRDGIGKGEAGLEVEVWETFRGGDWGNKGAVVPVSAGGADGGAVVFEARVVGGREYFMERSSFSVLSIFKNPIILLSMVSMALFFGMPKLVENMDPEMRAEWEERQKENPMNAVMGASTGQGVNPLGNFDMAGFLAGSSAKADEGSGGSGNGKGKGENRKKR